MTTHTLDARTLNPGDTFYLGAHIMNPRRVVRLRYAAVGVLEILHGSPNHPGKLDYVVYSEGARVLVPLNIIP